MTLGLNMPSKMNLPFSPTRKDFQLDSGLTTYVSDPLMNWLNKSSSKPSIPRPKSPSKALAKLTHSRKFLKGKSKASVLALKSDENFFLDLTDTCYRILLIQLVECNSVS